MKSLTSEERAALISMMIEPETWLDNDDIVGEEIRDRLVSQGRAWRKTHPSDGTRLAPDEDPGDWETLEWGVTELGKLALKVCT